MTKPTLVCKQGIQEVVYDKTIELRRDSNSVKCALKNSIVTESPLIVESDWIRIEHDEVLEEMGPLVDFNKRVMGQFCSWAKKPSNGSKRWRRMHRSLMGGTYDVTS